MPDEVVSTTPVASPFLIEKLLPSNRVHLLAGISSSGKSRFSIPAFIMWHACLPVLGLKSYPVPWCVVCGDRPLADIQDTLEGMGFPPDVVPVIPSFGKHNKSFLQVMEKIEDGGYKFVLWEGFDMLVRNPNNPNEVKELLSDMSSYCEEGLTVLGTVGVAKLKPNEVYPNPRQLVSGSTIWERATSTNLIILATNPGEIEDPNRVMHACLKNSASFSVYGKFDELGRLIFDDYSNRVFASKKPPNRFKM
jgi:hypothetical protein